MGSVEAALSITGSGPWTFTENFDTQATSPTKLPSSGSATWVDNTTIPGWYAQRTGTGSGIDSGTGTSITGNLYSFGATGSSERALGSIGSNNAAAGDFAWGVQFVNSTANSLLINQISYTGEQWRNTGDTNPSNQSLTFSYKISTTPISSLSPANAPGSDGWIAISSLDFASRVSGGSGAALDGNDSANRTALSISLPGITLAPDEHIMLRWRDMNHLPGSDHGLAIDDFSVSFSESVAAIPEPGSAVALGVLLTSAVGLHRRRKNAGSGPAQR